MNTDSKVTKKLNTNSLYESSSQATLNANPEYKAYKVTTRKGSETVYDRLMDDFRRRHILRKTLTKSKHETSQLSGRHPQNHQITVKAFLPKRSRDYKICHGMQRSNTQAMIERKCVG